MDNVFDFTYEQSIFLYEASAPVQESFFRKILDGVEKLYQTIRQWLSDFFNRKATDNKINEIETIFKNNPSLKSEKVKVHNYKQMDEVRSITLRKIDEARSVEEVNKQMKKYKRQRNKILAVGAVITVTAGAVFYNFLKQKNNAIQDLQKSNKKLQERVNSYRSALQKQASVSNKKIKKRDDVILSQKQEIEMLKAKSAAQRTKVRIKNAGFKYHNTVNNKVVDPIRSASDVATAKVSATVGIIKDGMNDIRSDTVETSKVLLDPKKGVIKKAGATVSLLGKNVRTVGKTTSQLASPKESSKRMSNATLDQIEKMQRVVRNASKVLKDKNATRDRKIRAYRARQDAIAFLQKYNIK